MLDSKTSAGFEVAFLDILAIIAKMSKKREVYMHISATDLKNKLGVYLEASIREPVIVEKSGRPSAVVISYQEFKRLLELEDKFWAMRALEAEKQGYLGPEETIKFLQDLEQKIKNADKED